MTGDKYQYLLVLYEALLTLRPGSGVVAVEFEIPDAGNVDDLVIIGSGGPLEYHQVKFVLEPTGDPLTANWFTEKKSDSDKATSPLQKFYSSFIKLGRPRMWLQTNRDADPEDLILGRRNGRNLNLGERLRAARSQPVRGAVKTWYEHLDLSRDELLDFLDLLHVQTGEPAYERLVVACGDRMRGEGLRGEPEAVKAALAMVEDLVIENKQRVDREELDRIIEKLGLRADGARATLLVQQVVEDPWPDAATVAVDWTGVSTTMRRRRVGGCAPISAGTRICSLRCARQPMRSAARVIRGSSSPARRGCRAGSPPDSRCARSPEDLILGRRNGRNLNLGERLRAARSQPVRGAVKTWYEHLDLSRDELLDFLDLLHVQTGEPAYERLVVACGDRMRGEGLRGEPEAVKAALAMVEDLVIENKQRVDREELDRIIEKLGLRADGARATLLVQQVVEDPWPDAATVAVDWTGVSTTMRRRRVGGCAPISAGTRICSLRCARQPMRSAARVIRGSSSPARRGCRAGSPPDSRCARSPGSRSPRVPDR